jgi:hypothetical protein|nr:MAG TPA: hypothetical protein [Bacteriophage sp.]
MVRIPRKLKKDMIKTAGRVFFIELLNHVRVCEKMYGFTPEIKIRKVWKKH